MYKNQAEEALTNPDKTTQNGDKIESQKRFGNQTVTVLVKKNEKGESIIISAWIDPPNPGTKDAKYKARYKESRKASGWKKIWLALLDQLGL